MPLLELDGITKTFPGREGPVHALTEVSLSVDRGETVGLIGESGSGKSTLGRIAVALSRPDAGEVRFDGHAITQLSHRALRPLRSDMQIVFQEPFESLNPRMRIGDIVGEPVRLHLPELDKAGRLDLVGSTLELVGLDASFARRYPHQLSGGQQQRVGIARAVVTRPKLVVLDEPTSSLDVSVRALILQLLGDLQRELGLAYLFISHDIGTVEHFCARTAVMYQGTIVEHGPTKLVVGSPRHPYTKALLSADLSPDPRVTGAHVPLGDHPARRPDPRTQCVLAGRCPVELDECHLHRVEDREVEPLHQVACVRVRPGVGEEVSEASAAPAARIQGSGAGPGASR